MRVLFVSDTHIGFDWPTRPRVERHRRGDDFLANFERALAVAERGEVDVVVHGGDLLFRSRVPAWISEAALAPLRRVASAGVPVLLVPGNHERSRISHPLLAIADDLHVFDRPRTLTLERRGVRVAFSGFPYTRNIRQAFTAVLTQARRDCGDEPAAADVRVLCMHHCIEGATCGPGNFVFRTGADVIRRKDLPGDVAVTLSGHIHRHQVLRADAPNGRTRGQGPVIYAGSVERTSFAEAAETKGFVTLELTRDGLGAFAFHALPARPMVIVTVSRTRGETMPIEQQLAAALATTPADAVVQLRWEGDDPLPVSAATLRELAGARNVTLATRFVHAAAAAGAGIEAGSRTVKAVPAPKRLSTEIAPPIK